MKKKIVWNSVVLLALSGCGLFGQTSFSNTTTFGHAVGIGGSTSPNPNPTVTSTIAVSGISGTVSKVTVTIPNLQADSPTDVDMVLIGPNGQNLVFMSDVGGTSQFIGGVTWDDTAAGSVLTQSTTLTAGTFKPSDDSVFNDRFNTSVCTGLGTLANAPGIGSATFATQFQGINPNGSWRLCVADDALGPVAATGRVGVQLVGGWTLTITTASAGTTSTVQSSLNPSFTGNSVTFTATVTQTSNGSPVNDGTVTFLDGATTIASGVAVNGSGQATTTTGLLTEGLHPISVQYTGSGGFGNSNGSMQQVVNNTTVISGNQFCNPGTISMPSTISPNPASVYPSRIFVSGLSGTLSKVTLSVNGISSASPDDWEWMVVAPNANNLIFWNDAGGFTPIAGVNVTFDDFAANALPNETALSSGTFRPTAINSTAASFPSPAPAVSSPSDLAAPFGAATFASKFGGMNPNGTWTLYGVDDSLGGTGSITSWCLTILTSASEAATTTTVSSSVNPSTTGGNVTFTATVTNASTAAPVTTGTVTFKEGATVLAGPTALNGSGQASVSKADLTEGAHAITAEYSGVAGSFAISNGSITQTVNNATVTSGTQFCNPGPLNIPANGASAQYPSRIFVTGLSGSVAKVTMQLRGLSNGTPDNLDFLVAAPNGNNLVVMSDVGGATQVSSQTITLDDAAASALPDDTTLTGGTFQPSDYSAIADVFPAPAPASVVKSAPQGAGTFATQFNGLNGVNLNGTWSLFSVVDSIGTAASSAAQGWCLTFTTTPDLSLSKTHNGNFSQGQIGAQYTIAVSNAAGSGPVAGTVTVVDTLPAGLTATAMDGTGWSCVLGTLTCTRADALVGGDSYPPITLTVNVAGNAPASVTNSVTVSGGGDVNTGNNSATDPTTVTAVVPITFATSPSGLSITVNGTGYTSPQILSLPVGSVVSVSTTSPQSGAAGTQYVFGSWSDAGALSHSYTVPAGAATLTATFGTQYQLTTAAGAGGTISPTTSFYDSGTVVPVTATANNGFVFGGFSGDLTGTTNPQSVTMSGPKSVTANFTALTGVTVTVPASVSFSLNGTPYVGSQTVNLVPGTYTLATTTPQSLGAGTQAVFAGWSDAGAISHSITVASSPLSITGTFTTQYQLTTAAGAGGTITPATGSFFDAGAVVPVKATANSGFVFSGFSGDLTGTTNPQSVTMNGPKAVAASFAAVTPTTLTSLITGKTGTANARVWTFTINNTGAGVANVAQLNSLALTQTLGAACTPTILTAFPVSAGTIAPGSSGTAAVTLDFSSCATTARFRADFTFSANGGAATGSMTLFNQFR